MTEAWGVEKVEEVEELEVLEPEADEGLDHAPGELHVPDDVILLEGEVRGGRLVAIAVARFNGEINGRLLESALDGATASGCMSS